MTPQSTIAGTPCRPADLDPVEIRGDNLDSTASAHLRTLKTELADEGYQPAELTIDCEFAEDCSLATQKEADRLREYVSAAAFLGAARVTIVVEKLANKSKVVPALSALKERARRDGIVLQFDGLDVS